MKKALFKLVDYGSDEWLKSVSLREDVLRKPLGSRFTEEELAAEKDHLHIAGYHEEELIAIAVLVPEGKTLKMQRVAVRPDLSDSGIGTQMMKYCEMLGLYQGFTMIYCHARDSAVRFYEKQSFIAEGDYFDEDAIPHLKMYKYLKDV